MQTPQVSPQQFEGLLKATDELHDAVRDYINAWIPKERPVPGSQLERECREFGDREAIVTAYDHGAILNDLVANQLIALTRALTPPYLSQASWTLLRMLLESAALSAWLLDPACGAADRVNRSYSYRYVGLMEQKKFAAVVNSPQISVAEADRKLAGLEAAAMAIGVQIKRGKNRKTDWIGMQAPSSTELVRIVFDEESWYRLLSSFVHGHQWAAFRLSYRQIDDGTGPDSRLVQWVEPFHMVGHLVKAALWFARPIWYRSRLNGFELTRLREILEGYADRPPRIAEHMRFWKAGE
jgi:hypothetical protein